MLQENLTSILDGPPSHKKPRHIQSAPLPTAPLESLGTSATMHDSRGGNLVAIGGQPGVGSMAFLSNRGEVTSARGIQEVYTTTAGQHSQGTQRDELGGYGRWSRPSASDDDDDEDVFYDSYPMPALISSTPTSAEHQSQPLLDVTSTISSRSPSHMPSAGSASASAGSALLQENNEIIASLTDGLGITRDGSN